MGAVAALEQNLGGFSATRSSSLSRQRNTTCNASMRCARAACLRSLAPVTDRLAFLAGCRFGL
jgi:hypothetical protein